MPLLAKKPETLIELKPKIKMMISGASGAGKTYFSLQFPRPVLIDTEGGAVRTQYISRLEESGGVYLGREEGSQDFKVVNDQVKVLATTQHEYKTLIVDSFSHLFMLEAAQAEERGGYAFGRDKKEAIRPTRQLIRWLEQLDMNVILICHLKDKWEGQGDNRRITGTTFDGWEKLEYILDLWIEILRWKDGGVFTVKKSRIEEFTIGSSFPLNYDKFADLYGRDVIERSAQQVQLATPDDVERLKKLLTVVNVPLEETEKWLDKVNAESWEELTQPQIEKCIGFLEKKIESVKGDKK